MKLYYSKKLMREFKLTPQAADLPAPEGLLNTWYAHCFKLDDAHFTAFLHTKTYYCALYINEQGRNYDPPHQLIYTLAITLECYGYTTPEIQAILRQFGAADYSNNENKSRIAYLNRTITDFKNIFRAQAENTRRVNIDKLMDTINTRPCKQMGFQTPKDLFLELVDAAHRETTHYVH